MTPASVNSMLKWQITITEQKVYKFKTCQDVKTGIHNILFWTNAINFDILSTICEIVINQIIWYTPDSIVGAYSKSQITLMDLSINLFIVTQITELR